MAISKACWGIDVGQCALKAVKLRQSGGELEAVSFDVIEHAKILSQPDADEQQLIRNALDKFLSRNTTKNDLIVVGVPGQASFSRFIKLPPVELKKVPEIVRYEARQQIPFNLDEVIWQHQVMAVPTGGPAEIEVGIFAMKRDIVQDYVNDFTQAKITPDIMQMAPVALYNYLRYDRREGAGATLLVDVGAENTSLVVADGYRVWIRNFPLGGNNFTEALVKSFKLTFAKAENLKRHAAESKYAREVFQAMRPVFSDLLTEIQRSIGFYTALHRESRIERVLAMGNTFRLAGLQKFLSQNLGVDVIKVEQFNTLHGDQVINAPDFKDNTLSFGVAFGLAIQGLGLGAINTTLLPPEILKAKELKKKRPYGAAAAAAIIAGFGLMAWGAQGDISKVQRPEGVHNIGDIEAAAESKDKVLKLVADLVAENKKRAAAFDTARGTLVAKQADLDAYLTLTDDKALWYDIVSAVWNALPKPDAAAQYNVQQDKDFSEWQRLDLVEVLRIRGEYDELFKTEEMPGTAAAPPMGGMPIPSMGGVEKRGTRVLVVYLSGTMPKAPGQSDVNILSSRLKQKLEQVPWFQNVQQVQNAVYRDAPNYPYELQKPVEEKPVEGAESDQTATPTPAGTRTSSKKSEPAKLINPWRGDDFFFELKWYINLDDRTQRIDPSELASQNQGGDQGDGLAPGVPNF